MEKFLTTAYKSKIIKLKMDEDPLHCSIFFVNFIELQKIIFLQYKETCEVVLDYQKKGGEDIKYYVR